METTPDSSSNIFEEIHPTANYKDISFLKQGRGLKVNGKHPFAYILKTMNRIPKSKKEFAFPVFRYRNLLIGSLHEFFLRRPTIDLFSFISIQYEEDNCSFIDHFTFTWNDASKKMVTLLYKKNRILVSDLRAYDIAPMAPLTSKTKFVPREYPKPNFDLVSNFILKDGVDHSELIPLLEKHRDVGFIIDPLLFMIELPDFVEPIWTCADDLYLSSDFFLENTYGTEINNSRRVENTEYEYDRREVVFPLSLKDRLNPTDIDRHGEMQTAAREKGLLFMSHDLGGKQEKAQRRKRGYFAATPLGALRVLAGDFWRLQRDGEFLHQYLCEITLPERPCKLFMDLEGMYHENPDWRGKEDALTLICVDYLISYLDTYFQWKLTYADFLFLQSDNSEKVSRHVISIHHMVHSYYLLSHMMASFYTIMMTCLDDPKKCELNGCKHNIKETQRPDRIIDARTREIRIMYDPAPVAKVAGTPFRPAACSKSPEEIGGRLRPLVHHPMAVRTEYIHIQSQLFLMSLLQYPYKGRYNKKYILDYKVKIGEPFLTITYMMDFCGKITHVATVKRGTKRVAEGSGGELHIVKRADPIALVKLQEVEWAKVWNLSGASITTKVKENKVTVHVEPNSHTIYDTKHGIYCLYVKQNHGESHITLMISRGPTGWYVSFYCHRCSPCQKEGMKSIKVGYLPSEWDQYFLKK
jgi:hypothetical protein